MNAEDLLAHADFIRLLARSLVGDTHQADDLEQETWLTAIEHPPRSDQQKVGSWLSTVLRNLTVSFYRKEQSRRKYENTIPQGRQVTSPDRILEKEEIRRQLIHTVLDLKEPYRTVIVLRYYDGLKPREIARHLDEPVERTRTHLKRGLERLRQKLDAHHDGNRNKWLSALAPVMGLPTSISTQGMLGSTSIASGITTLALKTKIVLTIGLIVGIALSALLIFSERDGDSLPGVSRIEDEQTSVSRQSTEEGIEKEAGELQKSILNPEHISLNLKGYVRGEENEMIHGGKVRIHILPHDPIMPAIEVSTDDEGMFLGCVPSPSETDKFSVYLQISAAGYLDLETTVQVDPQRETQDFGNFLLKQNHVHAVHIRSSEGKSIAHVQVSFFKINVQTYSVEKETDDEGFVKISDHELIWLDFSSNRMVLCVTAPGMKDIYRSFDRIKGVPHEVILSPQEPLSARVVDSETGKGIQGAEIYLEHCRRSYEHMIVNRHRVKTDEDGAFEFPLVDDEHGIFFDLRIKAEGFVSNSCRPAWLKSIPSVFTLKRISNPGTVFRVVNTHTNQPVSGLALMAGGDDVVTDDAGCFHYHSRVGEDYTLFLEVPGYRCERHIIVDKDKIQSGEILIPITPLIQKKQKIRVKNELGNPVTGATARISYSSELGTHSSSGDTNHSGQTELSLNSIMEADATISIRCPGYCPFISEPVLLGSSPDHIIDYVIKRGELYQGLHVVDPQGNSLSDARVACRIILESGDVMNLSELSDRRGICELAFASFKEGVAWISSHPATCIELDPEKIAKKEPIILGYLIDQPSRVTISGRVLDSEGIPLEKVWVSQRFGNSSNSLQMERTSKEGYFVFPAMRSETYDISIRPREIRGQWHWSVPDVFHHVTAGAELKMTMRSSNGVELSFNELFRKDICSIESLKKADTWLEDADGGPVEVDEVLRDGWSSVLLLGVPSGKMKAILKLDDARRFESPFFELEQGANFEIKFDSTMELSD